MDLKQSQVSHPNLHNFFFFFPSWFLARSWKLFEENQHLKYWGDVPWRKSCSITWRWCVYRTCLQKLSTNRYEMNIYWQIKSYPHVRCLKFKLTIIWESESCIVIVNLSHPFFFFFFKEPVRNIWAIPATTIHDYFTILI